VKDIDDKPPRYYVSIEIYDNETDKLIVDEGFNAPEMIYVIFILNKIKEQLESIL